jgi:phage terminase small subunit
MFVRINGVADAPSPKLSAKQEAFVAAYLGSARRNASEAARMAGYSDRTAGSQGHDLLKKPEIQAEIQAWREEAKQSAVTDMAHRLNVLDGIEQKLLAVIEARSDAYSATDVIGGDTAIVVRQYKMIGSGREAEMVEEYAVDTATIRELRAVHEQVAKELGQWTERHEHSGSITREFVLVPDVVPVEDVA